MVQLRDALIQAFMQRMQGVDHTAASYAADVVLQVLQQQGIPLQAPRVGAAPTAMKQAPMGKTPGYDKPGYAGEKAAPAMDKGAYGKAPAPMGKDAGYAKAPDPYGKSAPADPYGKGGGFKK